MAYTDPLPLRHSWPLFERERYFALGQLEGGARLDAVADIVDAIAAGQPLHPRIGQWECRLSDNRLSWSGEVYDIFGIARGAEVARGDAVALYAENSRAAMERLRAHAIRHRRGFTIDVEIRPDRDFKIVNPDCLWPAPGISGGEQRRPLQPLFSRPGREIERRDHRPPPTHRNFVAHGR